MLLLPTTAMDPRQCKRLMSESGDNGTAGAKKQKRKPVYEGIDFNGLSSSIRHHRSHLHATNEGLRNHRRLPPGQGNVALWESKVREMEARIAIVEAMLDVHLGKVTGCVENCSFYRGNNNDGGDDGDDGNDGNDGGSNCPIDFFQALERHR